MKVYVRGYGPKKRDEETDVIRIPPNDIEVEYSEEPQWKMSYRELAESECLILQKMRVHVGTHYCELSIEELPEGEFSIACLSHPEMRKP